MTESRTRCPPGLRAWPWRNGRPPSASAYNAVMGRLIGLALVLVLLAGGAMTLYNMFAYQVLSPLPLEWTHSPAEMELLELQRTREALARRLASERRIGSMSGLAVIAPESQGSNAEAELAVLDRRIAALRAQLGAGR